MSPSTDGVRLALFRGASDELITVEDALAALESGPVDDLGVEATTMSIVAAGREHLGAEISLGELPRLVDQLEPAATRVERGELALVRSASMDLEGIYLLFEPEPDDGVQIEIGVIEAPWSDWFPDDDAHATELYGLVAEHLDAMRENAAGNLFEPAHLPRVVVVDSLRREAPLGRRLVEQLGW